MIELIFTKGPRAGERFAVKAKSLSIGRLEECDIELNQSNVSRKHATIKREGKRLTITDHRSGNGTFVNGKRISQSILRDGDVVRIGSHTLRVEIHVEKTPQTVKEMLSEQPTRRELISRFFIKDRSGAPRQLEFAGDKLSLGRGEKCKLALDDEELSRLHATINFRAGCFELRDVGSANGTYLNGAPIIEAEIKDGDTLEMGRLIIGARVINSTLHLDITKKPPTGNITPALESEPKLSESARPSSPPVSPVLVKKLKDSRPLQRALIGGTPPGAKPRPRYSIIAGLAVAIAVALLLVFVGRTYAGERRPAPPARIDAVPDAVYSNSVPGALTLSRGAQTTTNH
jgi:pSer/pThr/pTyr-binding forkhead associated (FHA) protein